MDNINLKRVADFNNFMVERHNIFIRKELNNEPYLAHCLQFL